MIEGLAYALPVLTSAFIASGFADKITGVLGDGIKQAVTAGLHAFGLSVPMWALEVARVTAAIDRQVKVIGHVLAQIPLYLNPVVAAVAARFFQALPLLTSFAQRTGIIQAALMGIRQAALAAMIPFQEFGQAILVLLTGPPPDLMAILAPFIALLRPALSSYSTSYSRSAGNLGSTFSGSSWI